jgi:hypothetical protein
MPRPLFSAVLTLAAALALSAAPAAVAGVPATQAAQKCTRAGTCDRQPPRVRIVRPGLGHAVSGRLQGRECTVRVRDNRRIRRVSFYAAGDRLRSVVRKRGHRSRRASWSCVWNTNGLREGTYVLTAVAYDAAGNSSRTHGPLVVDRRHNDSSTLRTPQQLTAGAGPRGVVSGSTYYVSPRGSDANTGTSPANAWRTVGRVNQARYLRPGDVVLFEAGASFDDATLMPDVSGAPGAPIVYGAYGTGRASLPRGVWFKDNHHLVFEDLAVVGWRWQGVQGTGDWITVRRCALIDLQIGLNATGAGWQIERNVVRSIGDSGMILQGTGHAVVHNAITDVGLDLSVPGTHGIYLKSSHSRVVANSIRGFTDSGVSTRMRDSVIERNVIRQGEIGISWFQEDAAGATSLWRGNRIAGTTAAGIYISEGDSGGPTRESFVIAGNDSRPASGVHLNLKSTSGVYAVTGNSLL